jgi:uncharacterized protein (DUF433 family)
MRFARDEFVVNTVSDRESRFVANLAVVQDYLVRWKSSVDIKGIYVISPSGRTFDSIAFSILNKAYRLSQACIILLQAGYSDEAFGMARSLIECSLNLRYMPVDYSQIITVEPGKRSGKPCIRGLRITVYDVLGYMAAGMSHEEILADFPDLTETDIRACLAFAAGDK